MLHVVPRMLHAIHRIVHAVPRILACGTLGPSLGLGLLGRCGYKVLALSSAGTQVVLTLSSVGAQ